LSEPEDGLTSLGVAGSLARRYAEDQRDFADYLAAILESSLPGESRIERKGGLFSEKKIAAIQVHLGDFIYRLEMPPHGSLIPTRTKIVRGIKLNTMNMNMQKWLEALGAAISEYAGTSQEASEALQQLMGD
jgi:hypothetical protein